MAPRLEENRRHKVSAKLFSSSGKTSTIDRVVHKFKELLKEGELKPGDRIPNEVELARSFGTSRGSIREAIKMLVSFGVLQVRWGDGTYVSSSVSDSVFDHRLFHLLITSSDARHLLELREMMEFGIAKLAVDHALEEDLDAIEEAHLEMLNLIRSGEIDPRVLAGADARFHLALCRATHNPFVEKIYGFAIDLYYPTIVQTHTNRNTVEELLKSPEAHQGIIQAIRLRNKDAAQRAVQESLKTWLHHL